MERLACLLLLALAACKPAAKQKDDPGRCATCHMDDYRGARHPVHVGAMPTTCTACHAQESWHALIPHPSARPPARSVAPPPRGPTPRPAPTPQRPDVTTQPSPRPDATSQPSPRR